MTVLKLLVAFLFLFLPTWGLAKNEDVRVYEADLEAKIREIAQVQFNTPGAIAVSVKARLKPQVISDSIEPMDNGYMPLPMVPNDIQSFAERLDYLNVSLLVTDRISPKDIQIFTANVRSLLQEFKPRVTVRKVPFVEPKKTEEAKKPPQEPEKKPEENLSKKDYFNAALWMVAMVLGGIALYLCMHDLGKAIKAGASHLAQSLISVKANGTTKEKERDGKEEPGKPAAGTIKHPLHDAQTEKIIEKLKSFLNEDPLKLVNSFGNEESDLAGLRWFVSQLSDSEKQQLKSFLGPDRVKLLVASNSVPANFNVLQWAQVVIEKASLKKIEGGSVLEKALKPSDLAEAFRMDLDVVFKVAQEKNFPEFWRIALELTPETTFQEKRAALKPQDWLQIVMAPGVSEKDLGEAFDKFKFAVDVASIRSSAIVDTGAAEFEGKVLPSLISSVEEMLVGQDEEFLNSIRRTKPQMLDKIYEKFWPLSRLRDLEVESLKSVIAMQNNETLFALTLVLSNDDAEFIKTMIPEGIKRTVVLDMLAKARKKSDPQEMTKALKIAREFMAKLNQMNAQGKINLKKVELKRVA